MAKTEPTDDRQTRPFADWLGQQRRGAANTEVSEALQELIEAVTAHAKKGKLVLTVEVRPSDEFGRVEIWDDLKIVKPVPKRASSLFFVDDDSNLSREDPRQQKMPLEAVPDPQADTGTGGN